MDKKQKKARLRQALYGVVVAATPILVLTGIINTAEEAVYLVLVDSLLSLAFYNVDTTPES